MQVNFTITETQEQLPDSVDAGPMLAELLDSSGNVEQAVHDTTMFSGVTAGDKTLRLSRLDSNGNTFGAVYTQTFTVDQDPPAPVRTAGIPTGVTITVSADIQAG